MKQVNTRLPKIATLLMAALLVIVFVGCSEEFNSPVSSNSAKTVAPPELQYPELTPDFLTHAMSAGYRALPALNTLDDCDTSQASAACTWNKDKTINISHFIEFKYFNGCSSSNLTITIVAPNSCVPAADFYPHPTQFNSSVRLKFKIHEMGYDQIVDPATLVPMYWNENTGLCEPLDFTWEGNYQCMIVLTNHFSRYIVGQRCGG